MWENPNMSIEEIEMDENIEKTKLMKSKSKVIVIKSNSLDLQMKEEKVFKELFICSLLIYYFKRKLSIFLVYF